MYEYAILTEKLLPISFLSYISSQNLPIGQLVEVPIRNSLEKGIIFKQSRGAEMENAKLKTENGSIDPNVDSSLTLISQEKPVNNTDNSLVNPANISTSKDAPTPVITTNRNYEVKEIENVLPYIFSSNLMNFWQSVAFNNFSSLNRVLSAGLESFNLLTKADWKIITANFEENKLLNLNRNNLAENLENLDNSSTFKPSPKKIGKTEYLSGNKTDFKELGDIDSTLRIMYLIRNVEYRNTLIIFPEIKLLKKWLHQINLKEFSNISLYTFTSGKDKASKATIKSLLLPDTKNLKKNVYFTTRAGLFLPYNQISAIFVADESNSMHIQEQGGLYFDVRETAYILASQFGSDLYYQSNFPSVRFFDFAKVK